MVGVHGFPIMQNVASGCNHHHPDCGSEPPADRLAPGTNTGWQCGYCSRPNFNPDTEGIRH